MYAADPERLSEQGFGFRSSCAAARFSQGEPMMIASWRVMSPTSVSRRDVPTAVVKL